MISQEESVEKQLAAIAAAWRSAQRLGERIATVKRSGLSWRAIASRTGIPMTSLRRWAQPFLTGSDREQ